MKVLLIQTPARTLRREEIIVPPLGLLYLAAALERDGHEVEVLDAFAERLGWEDFEERLRHSGATAAGIGGMTPVWDLTRRALKIMRPRFDIIFAGGPHVSAMGEKIFEDCPEIDHAVIGEGEDTLVELLRALENSGDPTTIRGTVNPRGAAPTRPPISDLDSLPFPARHLIREDLYRYPLLGVEPVTTMFTSRGCPYRCIFCDKTIFGSSLRERSAESVLDEMEHIVCQDGITSVIIYDDLFTLNRERVIKIAKGMVERGINLRWKCEGRVDRVDAEMLGWMHRAGLKVMAYGVETKGDDGLKFLRKDTTSDQAMDAFRLTHEAGIDTVGYFILGIPGERPLQNGCLRSTAFRYRQWTVNHHRRGKCG